MQMKTKLAVFFVVLSKAILTNGQTNKLLVDSLVVETGCLGSSHYITIAKNTYKIKTSDVMIGNSDTLIYLNYVQVDLLNKQLNRFEKVKSKDRIRKINYTCPCYRNLIITTSNNERNLGRYISSKPPRIFRKINNIINSIE